MSNLDRYERLAAEAIRAAVEGAAVARFDDELVLRPSRAAIEAMTEADLLEVRAHYATTASGQALLRSQGFTDAQITDLADRWEKRNQPGGFSWLHRQELQRAETSKPAVTSAPPAPAVATAHIATPPVPQPAIIKAPVAAIAPPVAISPSVTPPIAAPSTTVSPPVLAGTPEGWRAQFAASPDLQREFGSVDLYCTYRQGVAAGRIRHHGGQHRCQ